MRKVNQELLRAVGKDDLRGVERALRQGADPNCRGHNSTPILFSAVDRCDAAIVSCLLAAGADPKVIHPRFSHNAFGYLMLGRTLDAGRRAAPIVRLQLQNGVTADKGARPGSLSPWWLALVGGYAEVVSIMIEAGIDVNRPLTQSNLTPLMAAACERDAAIVDLLLRAGADPRAESASGTTALAMVEAPPGDGEDDSWALEATEAVASLLRRAKAGSA